MHVLTWKEVRAIRRDASCGRLTQRQIAEKYGVSQSTVCRVVNETNWKERRCD
jgi:DNA-binding transcriptional regulator LsrR (DeoR family)